MRRANNSRDYLQSAIAARARARSPRRLKYTAARSVIMSYGYAREMYLSFSRSFSVAVVRLLGHGHSQRQAARGSPSASARFQRAARVSSRHLHRLIWRYIKAPSEWIVKMITLIFALSRERAFWEDASVKVEHDVNGLQATACSIKNLHPRFFE